MRKKAVLAGVLLLHCLSASAGRTPRKPRGSEPPAREPKVLGELYQRATALLRQQAFAQAAALYEEGYSAARRLGDARTAIRFLVSSGGCRFSAFEYRAAMRAYLEAARLAETSGDLQMAAVTFANISSLYVQLGDLEAGREAIGRGLEILRRHGPSPYRAQLLLQDAIVHARKGDPGTAMDLFRQGIGEADRGGDVATLAVAWDQLGYELLRQGRAAEAEGPLLEAFRLRRLGRLPDLQYSYYTLGMLRLAQGDAAAANCLLEQAVRQAVRGKGTMPLWRVFFQRGRARTALGRLRAGLDDFETASGYARRWRVELLTADSVGTGSTAELDELHFSHVAAAIRLYERRKDPRLAMRALEVDQENRAATLRSLFGETAEWRQKLSAEYWRTLADLQRLETGLLGRRDRDAEQQALRLRSKLTELEARAGLDLTNPLQESERATAGPGLARCLRPGEALIVFHLAEPASYVWAVTQEGLRLYTLPSRARVARLAASLKQAVKADSPACRSEGRAFYEALFGGLDGPELRKPDWLLVLDDALFESPLGALVAGCEDGKPVYLIERHSLRILPVAWAVTARHRFEGKGQFVGVGDPVYNKADPRWRHRPLDVGWRDSGLQLTRLVGGAREVSLCARAWDSLPGQSTLLTGTDASVERLRECVGRSTAVVHFATHFLAGAEPGREGLIVLGLKPSGEPESLSPLEIKHWRLSGSLVVLSGCSSGAADVLPGEGLMGMTRAWLAAGAASVVASLWPTVDEDGRIFVSFYRHLRQLQKSGRPGLAASALRLAQLDMLRSETPEASPKYWAAYFTVGRE